MKIIDLTGSYLTFLASNNSEQYINSHPFLFSHYFQYWANQNGHFKRITKEKILQNKQFILNSINKIIPLLKDYDIDISCINIILFVGQETANGHALIYRGKGTAWISAEYYNSQFYS